MSFNYQCTYALERNYDSKVGLNYQMLSRYNLINHVCCINSQHISCQMHIQLKLRLFKVLGLKWGFLIFVVLKAEGIIRMLKKGIVKSLIKSISHQQVFQNIQQDYSFDYLNSCFCVSEIFVIFIFCRNYLLNSDSKRISYHRNYFLRRGRRGSYFK